MPKRTLSKILIYSFIFVCALSLIAGCGLFEREEDIKFIPVAPEIEIKPEQEPEPAPTDSAEPAPEPSPEPDNIERIMSAMTDEELIGQMVMCGFEGTSSPSSAFEEFMQEHKLGNIILFGNNTETFEQTKMLIARVNAMNGSDIPLSFSIDVEGGNVLRFHWSPHIKSAKTLGDKNDTEFTYEQYKRIGEKLREIGITIDLAPVLDIAQHTEGTFLGKRMFGGDPAVTVPQAQAAVRGLHDGGLKSFGKHYPGHGATATDSHEQLPVLYSTKEELEEYEFTMFEGAVSEGIDGMLVGHLSYPNVDDSISSVSEVFITDILREDMGFDGVIMSDDMRMQAIASTIGISEGAVRFVEAGGDLVLIGKGIERQEKVFTGLTEALASGRLTRERLEKSVYRILLMKGFMP